MWLVLKFLVSEKGDEDIDLALKEDMSVKQVMKYWWRAVFQNARQLSFSIYNDILSVKMDANCSLSNECVSSWGTQ